MLMRSDELWLVFTLHWISVQLSSIAEPVVRLWGNLRWSRGRSQCCLGRSRLRGRAHIYETKIVMTVPWQINEFLALLPAADMMSYSVRWRHTDDGTSNPVEIRSQKTDTQCLEVTSGFIAHPEPVDQFHFGVPHALKFIDIHRNPTSFNLLRVLTPPT
jgi:hypothetical protein